MANGTITIGFSSTQQGCIWNVTEWQNIWSSGVDNGSSAIVQYASFTGTAITSGTITLSAFGTAGSWNGIYGVFAHPVNQAHTPETGYTALGSSLGHNSPVEGMLPQWKSVGGDLTVSNSWTTSSHGGGIALELNAARKINSRPLSFGKAVKAVVSQAKIAGGNTVRNVTLVVSKAYRVSRLVWYKRSIVFGKPVTAVVSRLRRLIRTIVFGKPVTALVSRGITRFRSAVAKIAVFVAVSRLRRLLRTISEAISFKATVSRIGRYLKTIGLTIGIKATVSRLQRYLRTISFGKTVTFSVRATAAKVRNAVAKITVLAVVNYKKWWFRTVRANVPVRATVSRIGRYIRTIGLTIGHKAIVTLHVVGGITVRAVSLIIAPAIRVSRLGRYIRKISFGKPVTALVSRFRLLSRKLTMSLPVKAVVNRLRWLVRTISLVRPTTMTLKKLQRFLRDIRLNLSAYFQVSRVGRYLRKIASVRPIGAVVSGVVHIATLYIRSIITGVPTGFRIKAQAVLRLIFSIFTSSTARDETRTDVFSAVDDISGSGFSEIGKIETSSPVPIDNLETTTKEV